MLECHTDGTVYEMYTIHSTPLYNTSCLDLFSLVLHSGVFVPSPCHLSEQQNAQVGVADLQYIGA